MKQWILWLILILAFILEGTITTLPLVLISFLILMIFLRKPFLFWIALITGLILDAFLFRPLGLTALLLTVFLFVITLYENKFEASSGYFVLISSFLGSFIYLLIFKLQTPFLQAIFTAFLSLGIFKLLMHSEIKKPKYRLEG